MASVIPAQLAARATRQIGTHVGEPRMVKLPADCPVYTFVCPVRLTPGCLPPPGRLSRRIGAGSAIRRAAARSLCLLEGIERYSLQYRKGDPDFLSSAKLPNAREAKLDTEMLRLGHPAQRGGGPTSDSRGCAVGTDLADAAVRGLLELIEHDAVESWFAGQRTFRQIEADDAGLSITSIRHWIATQELQLQFLEHRHRSGAIVVLCICNRTSGARPVVGSAAGLDPGRTATHACLESVVGWFNLAQIDANAIAADELPPASRRDLELFCGSIRLPQLQDNAAANPALATWANPHRTGAAEIFSALAGAWEGDIAVFDLSRSETGFTTVRTIAANRL